MEIITAVYNFDINAGATLERYVHINLPYTPPEVPVPFPLTGFIGRAQIRKNASAELFYAITITIVADGLIKLSMLPSETTAIPCGNLLTDMKSKYQWALELESPTGYVIKPLEGIVRVSPEIVR